jgi:thiamine biosynthesis protein ThiC
MDLSTVEISMPSARKIIRHSSVPVGTVPIYEAAIEAVKKRALTKMSRRCFEVIERQAEEGVDFMTVHCGESIGGTAKAVPPTDEWLAGVDLSSSNGWSITIKKIRFMNIMTGS